MVLFISDKGKGKCVCPRCLSVCLSVCEQDYSKMHAWIWMKMLHVDRCRDMDMSPIRIIVQMPEPDCFLRYRICAATRNFITSGKSHVQVFGTRRGFKMVLITASRGTALSEVHALHRVLF